MQATDAVESEGMIRFLVRQRGPVAVVAPDGMVAADGQNGASEVLELTRAQETELPQVLKWTVARADEEYDVAVVEAARVAASSARVTAESFPLAAPPEEAARRARRGLAEAWVGHEIAAFALPPSRLAIDPGDVVQLANDGRLINYRITGVADAGLRRIEAVRQDRAVFALPPEPPRTVRLPRPPVWGAPEVVLMDLPQVSAEQPAHAPLVAAHARPWRAASRSGVARARTASSS